MNTNSPTLAWLREKGGEGVTVTTPVATLEKLFEELAKMESRNKTKDETLEKSGRLLSDIYKWALDDPMAPRWIVARISEICNLRRPF